MPSKGARAKAPAKAEAPAVSEVEQVAKAAEAVFTSALERVNPKQAALLKAQKAFDEGRETDAAAILKKDAPEEYVTYRTSKIISELGAAGTKAGEAAESAFQAKDFTTVEAKLKEASQAFVGAAKTALAAANSATEDAEKLANSGAALQFVSQAAQLDMTVKALPQLKARMEQREAAMAKIAAQRRQEAKSGGAEGGAATSKPQVDTDTGSGMFG